MGFAREPTTLEPLFPIRLDAWSRSDARSRPLRVECVDFRAMLAQEAAWSDLARRAIEPNVFLMPAFAIPLLQHIRLTARPKFLVVWDDASDRASRLLGLLPVHDRQRPWFGIVRGFLHPQMALGTPLLDEQDARDALEAMLGWLGQQTSRPTSLILNMIPTEGAFAVALRDTCADHGRGLTMLDPHQRAILRHRDVLEPLIPSLSQKKRKELGRQRRRMEGFGALVYRRASAPADIRRAAELFLALEFEGWKGRRGTALLADPTLATFTRTMTRLMAHDGQCRIDSLEIDGVPVAMGILVMAGTRAHFWKTAFSERYAMFSPGVQFTLALTRVQAADDGVSFTDSCAVPDHPMIDRIWADRLAIADVMIELRPSDRAVGGRGAGFQTSLRVERLRRRLRGSAKTLVHALRARLHRVS